MTYLVKGHAFDDRDRQLMMGVLFRNYFIQFLAVDEVAVAVVPADVDIIVVEK